MKRFDTLIQQSFVILLFLVLAVYTFAYFFKVPYFGFDFSSGIVVEVTTDLPDASLQVGDELVQVGDMRWEDFVNDSTKTLLPNVQQGEQISIVIRRQGEILTIPWTIPGFSREALLKRLYNTWWLPYLFWIAAAVTFLFIRPKDIRWHLLIAFNLLTALWLSVGSGPARWHIWYSAIIFKATIWLCIPVYLHLHWLFPKPLGRLSLKVIWGGYAAAGVMAVLELFQLLPSNLHLLGFLVAIAGILALLIAHIALRPEQRDSLRFLLVVVTVIILPVIAGSVVSLTGNFRLISLSFLGFPFLPIAYIYTIYRHRLGKLELRANRVITLYVYFIIICSAAIILGTLFTELLGLPDELILFILITAVVVGLITVIFFPEFERFVERRILGISLPPASLLETYATQIVTILDKADLVQLLNEQVLPTLLVRQSAVIYWGVPPASPMVFTVGIEQSDLPTDAEIPLLLNEAGSYRPLLTDEDDSQLCPWVRLCLPLMIGDKPMGLWLLGRRDPDDIYVQREIPTLQALAAQTAIAFTNILQTENLHRLYQANIDSQERERTHLALEMHDDILNQMALLVIYVDDDNVAPQFFEVFDQLTMRFRQTIRGLRPAMLNYGLRAALDDLVDQVNDRLKNCITLLYEVPASTVRYPSNVEQHIFRIVQQAVENSLQHAEARQLRIAGFLDVGKIDLVIEDDGKGFLAGEHLNLSSLLMNQHFGLVGMYERAALIGAEVRFYSTPQQGTKVSLSWHSSKAVSVDIS